jgi:hypothetical protein
MRSLAASAVIIALLGAAGAAQAQEPPTPADLPTPGSATVEGVVTVTRQEQVRVNLRCITGEVACSGTVKLQTLRPVSPGKGKARRVVTVAEGSIGTMQPGELKKLTLSLEPEIRRRVRGYRSTDISWDSFAADGTKNSLMIRHNTTLVSRAVR